MAHLETESHDVELELGCILSSLHELPERSSCYGDTLRTAQLWTVIQPHIATYCFISLGSSIVGHFRIL